MKNFCFALCIAFTFCIKSAFGSEAGLPQLDPEFWPSQVFWLILIFSASFPYFVQNPRTFPIHKVAGLHVHIYQSPVSMEHLPREHFLSIFQHYILVSWIIGAVYKLFRILLQIKQKGLQGGHMDEFVMFITQNGK